MRSIKFRAIHILTFKKWYEEDLYFHNGEWFEDFRALEDGRPLNLEQCEVMQYTGLKDKNGVEIYEGDIVKGKAIECQGGFTYTGVIEFLTHNTVHGWHLREFDGGGYELKQLQARISLDNITGEVIGNIYEHKHLLD